MYLLMPMAMLAFAGGCAKHGVVKENEVLQPAVPAKSQEAPLRQKPADAVVAPQAVKEEAAGKPATGDKAASKEAAQEAGLTLETLYFDFDSSTLTPAARDALINNARLLSAKGPLQVRIEGHCDERGSDEYNLALGEKRAKAALKYLSAMGIPDESLSTISYGKEKPADAGHNEAAWAKNRRDQFIVISK
jgi:peptidoglycan-associated lipoprotein